MSTLFKLQPLQQRIFDKIAKLRKPEPKREVRISAPSEMLGRRAEIIIFDEVGEWPPIESTPTAMRKENYFYRLWMEGEPKFEVICAPAEDEEP